MSAEGIPDSDNFLKDEERRIDPIIDDSDLDSRAVGQLERGRVAQKYFEVLQIIDPRAVSFVESSHVEEIRDETNCHIVLVGIYR